MASDRADCASVSDSLAADAGSDRAFGPLELDHLATCLRCRAEQSRYQRLMEAMGSIRAEGVLTDSRLESQILSYLDGHASSGAGLSRFRLAAAVGGLAAGAAATAGVVAVAVRHRRTAGLAG